jgi:CrcB protein
MSALMILALALAGACGASARFMVDYVCYRYVSRFWPLGTLLVNVSGAFALGVVLGLAINESMSPHWITIVGTGLIGAYTTFSTWMVQLAHQLAQQQWRVFTLNVVLPIICGPAAAWLGVTLVIGLQAG